MLLLTAKLFPLLKVLITMTSHAPDKDLNDLIIKDIGDHDFIVINPGKSPKMAIALYAYVLVGGDRWPGKCQVPIIEICFYLKKVPCKSSSKLLNSRG